MDTGNTDGMGAYGYSPNNIYTFTRHQMPQGVGTIIARAFLENHTLINITARIIPNPDWCMWIDSYQLYVGRNFVDTVTVQVIIVDEM